MRRLSRLAFLLLVVLGFFVPLAVFAQDASDGNLTTGVGIIGIVIAVIASALTAFGVGKSAVGKAMAKLHADYVDFAAIDKAVEEKLGKIGVPQLLADYIGDIVAQFATRGPELFSKPLLVTLKEIIVDEFSRRSALQAAKIADVPVALASNRASRAVVAETYLSTPKVQEIVVKAASKAGL